MSSAQHSAFSPHAQLKSPHIASLRTPSPPSLTCTVRNHSLTASTPTKVKMNVLATCGGNRTREWERKKERRKRKDMASVHGSESVQQDSDADINSMYHESSPVACTWQKCVMRKKREKLQFDSLYSCWCLRDIHLWDILSRNAAQQSFQISAQSHKFPE